MKRIKNFSLDKLFVLSSILYLVIPVIIFFFGWLKTIYATILTTPFLVLCYFVYKQIIKKDIRLFTKENTKYWLISIAVLFIWVYFSGIGGFSFQNGDHWVRNPIYRDLCKYDWPLIYNLSEESSFIQSITGTGNVAFSYYFTWWLIPALISKLFNLSELGHNVVLLVYSLIGLLLILYNINRIIGKCTYKALLILVFFSGMDIVRCLFYRKPYYFVEHIEWWNDLFWIQYSSNSTQLYWVFNQSIPLWIIMGLVMQLDNNRFIGCLCALSFVYSPWATLGIVPIAWVGSFFRKQSIKQAFNPINTIVTIIIAVVYGVFYMASSGSEGGIGTTLSFYRDRLFGFIIDYLLFLIIEVVIYWVLIYKENKDDKYFWIVTLELLSFPLVWMRDGNFTMRASIPALFIFMIYIINSLYKTEKVYIKYALIITLLIGSFTSISEINRSITNTLNGNIDNEEEIFSFGDIKTQDIARINIVKDQFFIYDYQNSLFFRYLAKEKK